LLGFVSFDGRVWYREWNPTIPKQPSGDFRGVVDIEDVVLRMLRQRIWRVLMGVVELREMLRACDRIREMSRSSSRGPDF
jgi:hypothetical protein